MQPITAFAVAIQQLDARLRTLANRERSLQSYTAPTFAGTWANSGGAFATAAYWKDPWGTVHLKGRVIGGAGLIFTLPVKYRPLATLSFEVATGNVVDIESDGEVRHASGAAPVSLDGISFRAEA